MRFIKGLLKFIACCVVLLVVAILAVMGDLAYSMHKLVRHSQRMHVGMSVREFVQVMPTDYFSAKVLRARRDVACRGPKGEFVPPEDDDPARSEAAAMAQPAQDASKVQIAGLAPCPAVDFAHFKYSGEGKIYLEVQRFGGGTVVTSDQFAEFIEKEFRDSDFYVGFSYTTHTPQHQTFGVDFDRTGHIARIVQPYGWD